MTKVNDILSNEEIDALLDMFRSGAVDEVRSSASAPEAPADERCREVDLLKPNRLAREQLRGMQRYFESAAKLLSATISDKLRIDARCDCVAVEQQRFGTWLEQLPGPVAMYVVGMEPLKTPVLLTGSTSLLYGAVDRILGGSGRVARVPKDFTQAEYTVADALMGPCLDRIVESLEDVVKLQWSIESRFCNPSMAQTLPSQDVVLSVHFQVSGEFLIGDLRLMIPFQAIEPFLEKFAKDSVTRMEPGAMKDRVARTVRSVPLDLAVELGGARITLRQLLDLQSGDVIPLETRFGSPAVVPVMGKPKFLGQIGRIGNRLAVQVADVMDE